MHALVGRGGLNRLQPALQPLGTRGDARLNLAGKTGQIVSPCALPLPLPTPPHTLCAPQQGLEYLHHHKVVHGDLKPANLILDSNTRRVKIVDFGSSVLNTNRPGGAHGTGMTSMIAANVMGPGTMACTPGFRSPESLQPGYRLSFEVRRRSG